MRKKVSKLFIDADALPKNFYELFLNIQHNANSLKAELSEVFIVGKDQILVEKIVFFLKKEFNIKVTKKIASSRKNSSDIYISFFLGMELSKSKDDLCNVYLYTNDLLIVEVASEVIDYGINLIVYSFNLNREQGLNQKIKLINMKLKKTGHSEVENSIEYSFPKWAYEYIEHKKNGLTCDYVPNTNSLIKPEFIGFPDQKSHVLIGSKSNKLDIELYYWESEKTKLYSPHVEFKYQPYPISMWSMRSLRGVRRGAKKVLIDGKDINAQLGYVNIKGGMKISLGNFEFTFKENRLNNLAVFEDKKQVIEELELKLNKKVKLFSEIHIPQKVISDLTYNGEFSWDNAYIKHYQNFFAKNWEEDEFFEIREKIGSKSKLKMLFGNLIRIRNIVMHPSKGLLSEEDSIKLSEIYILLCDIL